MKSLRSLLEAARDRLLSGFLWNFMSAVATQGSVLISSIAVARLLGVDLFGNYTIVVSTIAMTAAVAQGGSGLVASRYISEFRSAHPERVGRIMRLCRLMTLLTGTVAAIVLFASAAVLSTVFKNPDLEFLFQLGSVATFFQVAVAYQQGALQGFGAFRELARIGLFTGLAQVVCSAVGAAAGDAPGALVGYVLASAIRSVVFAFALNRVALPHRSGQDDSLTRDDAKLIFRFALPAALGGLVTLPCLWVVTVFVSHLPEGAVMVAVFAAANQIRFAILQLPNLLNTVSLTVLNNLKGMGQQSNYRRVFWANFAVNSLFSLGAAAATALFADSAMHLYGSSFVRGEVLLLILLISVVPETMATTTYQLVQSAERMWLSLFVIALPRDVLYAALAFLLVPRYGVEGAAISYLTAHTLALVSTAFVAKASVARKEVTA
ncbi:MAG TPA: oligosaccharide flippase family protein [Lysobacter sp.]|jgi:O-antigen/teichoic acid export membrane protein|nr:oligosaccharide flippase family protein [Lysobacter sp.]